MWASGVLDDDQMLSRVAAIPLGCEQGDDGGQGIADSEPDVAGSETAAWHIRRPFVPVARNRAIGFGNRSHLHSRTRAHYPEPRVCLVGQRVLRFVRVPNGRIYGHAPMRLRYQSTCSPLFPSGVTGARSPSTYGRVGLGPSRSAER